MKKKVLQIHLPRRHFLKYIVFYDLLDAPTFGKVKN